MPNNRIYIECLGCKDSEPLYMGKRMVDGYYRAPSEDTITDWFDVHKHCGGTHDHFKIGYDSPENYDMDGAAAIFEEKLR